MKTFQTTTTVKTALLVASISLTLACGYSAKMTAPVAGVVPAIASLAPPSTLAGGGAFTLTVNGSNFGAKAVVNLNGAAQASSTTFVGGGQLTVMVPASTTATAGTVAVTVTNPGTTGTGIYGTGGTMPETSSPMSFTVN